ncbi:unnamed protein product [marine sediment metagenome]|uniref:Uncharacterized protein n=1 Tax=marine sediment metagenome TaxID=412755 RepID=X1IVS0_9ZZZZ
MSIDSPATYGEHYWKMQVDAQRLTAEDTEKELAAMASRLMSSLHLREFLPEEFELLFGDIEAPAGAFLGDVGGRFVSEVADGAVSRAANPFFRGNGLSCLSMDTDQKNDT